MAAATMLRQNKQRKNVRFGPLRHREPHYPIFRFSHPTAQRPRRHLFRNRRHRDAKCRQLLHAEMVFAHGDADTSPRPLGRGWEGGLFILSTLLFLERLSRNAADDIPSSRELVDNLPNTPKHLAPALRWPGDHDCWNSELCGSIELVRGRAAGVFADEVGDAVVLHQFEFGLN